MVKTIGELHYLLIEYEKGLPKKAATPQEMAIQGGIIQKANKKSLNAKGKEVGHCKRNCPAYLAELIKKKKQVDTASSSDIFRSKKAKTAAYSSIYTQHNGVSKRRNHTLLDMVRSMMNLTTLSLSFWDYALESAARILNMAPTKKVWGCEALVKRDTSNKLQQRSVKCIFIRYLKGTMGYYFYFPPENKIVVARDAEFLEKNLISQEVSRRAVELEEIQVEDTSPSENTSEIPMEVEGFKPPQEELIPVRMF
ncbi:retrotransposon protein, putative, ty1-copia subclass, partial [Tanacetum coccineum]